MTRWLYHRRCGKQWPFQTEIVAGRRPRRRVEAVRPAARGHFGNDVQVLHGPRPAQRQDRRAEDSGHREDGRLRGPLPGKEAPGRRDRDEVEASADRPDLRARDDDRRRAVPGHGVSGRRGHEFLARRPRPPPGGEPPAAAPPGGRGPGRGPRRRLHPSRHLPAKLLRQQGRQRPQAHRLRRDRPRPGRVHAAGGARGQSQLHGPGGRSPQADRPAIGRLRLRRDGLRAVHRRTSPLAARRHRHGRHDPRPAAHRHPPAPAEDRPASWPRRSTGAWRRRSSVAALRWRSFSRRSRAFARTRRSGGVSKPGARQTGAVAPSEIRLGLYPLTGGSFCEEGEDA